jgi:hypothetical protein
MTIPKRLIVIEATIPTGESCEGCEFSCGIMECSPTEFRIERDKVGCKDTAFGEVLRTDGLRLPACRTRDGYVVLKPGSAGARLLETIMRHGSDLRDFEPAARYAVVEAAAAYYHAEQLQKALDAERLATSTEARKVAGEGEAGG